MLDLHPDQDRDPAVPVRADLASSPRDRTQSRTARQLLMRITGSDQPVMHQLVMHQLVTHQLEMRLGGRVSS